MITEVTSCTTGVKQQARRKDMVSEVGESRLTCSEWWLMWVFSFSDLTLLVHWHSSYFQAFFLGGTWPVSRSNSRQEYQFNRNKSNSSIVTQSNVTAPHHHHNHFMALFPGPPGWAGTRIPEENFWTLWCKGRLTRRHTDHPAGWHSIWTNQCPPPPSHSFYRPDALPATQPTVWKDWRQLAYSD